MGNEKRYILDALSSNWIAPLGPYVNAFEKKIQGFLGKENVITVSSCTAAIHLSLILAGVESGDTVFCSNLTFAASAFPIMYCRGKPVFIDSEPKNYNMDHQALIKALKKEKKKPKALILVHLYGMPANVAKIKEICDEYDIVLIEDAAEALGATCNGLPVGTFGRFGTWSFNGNKIITASCGGALYANFQNDLEIAFKYSNQSRENYPWYEHIELGYNYRLSNICAAIGLGQIENITKKIKKKKKIYEIYKRDGTFGLLPDFAEDFNAGSNYWITCSRLKGNIDRMITELSKIGIEARRIWKPMSLQPVFENTNIYSQYDYSPSEDLFNNGICLPSDTRMSYFDQQKVIKAIKKLL